MFIVLVHGLIGFGSGFEKELGIEPTAYWWDIPKALSDAGFTVAQAQLPPTGSVVERAAALTTQVLALGDEVHLVAHSMGGLDARYAITHLGLSKVVRSLTTFGTPHSGTALADDGEELVWGAFAILRFIGADTGAYSCLTRAACQAFNANTLDSPDVAYRSIAGWKAWKDQPFGLRVPSALLHFQEGGLNDGLVGLGSASRWPSTEIWPDCNHADLLGWPGPYGSGKSRAADYTRILKEVVDGRG